MTYERLALMETALADAQVAIIMLLDCSVTPKDAVSLSEFDQATTLARQVLKQIAAIWERSLTDTERRDIAF